MFWRVPTHKQQQVQNRLQLGNHPDVLWWNHYLTGQRLSADAATAGLKQGTACYTYKQIREIPVSQSSSPRSTAFGSGVGAGGNDGRSGS